MAADDLFSATKRTDQPLAARLRPRTLDDIVGQAAVLGRDTPIGRRLRSGRIRTLILYGPAGVGKTTIAKAAGLAAGREFRTLHPAEAGIAELRALARDARERPLLAFIDEIHRFGAAVMDVLLGYTEDGVFDLMGATTGNPYHVLTPALVSRATIAKLEPLGHDDITILIRRALAKVKAEGCETVMSGGQIKQVAARAGGDARRAINVVELLAEAAAPGKPTFVSDADVAAAFAAAPIPNDRAGDFKYDVISAFIKSCRGSDPDAALHYLARLIHGGEDPRYIAGRLMIMASEDVGLADNSCLATTTAALTAVGEIGYPEAEIVLAHATLHVALAPKSNSAYRGIKAAMRHLRDGGIAAIPAYLRDAHYAGAAKLGHAGYRTPHDSARGWIADQPLTPHIEDGAFYRDESRGTMTFEGRAAHYWADVKGQSHPERDWPDDHETRGLQAPVDEEP